MVNELPEPDELLPDALEGLRLASEDLANLRRSLGGNEVEDA